MSHFDVDSTEVVGKEISQCPFCDAINDSCKHLIVRFNVSDDTIEAGLLVNHQDEISVLMAGRKDEIEDSFELDQNIGEFTAAVRAFLEQHPEVEWAEYSIGEANDIWDYASYWARYPGMVMDDLYRQLEAAILDN